MPKGTCVLPLTYKANDSSTYGRSVLVRGNGTVTADIRYGWDGVSVFPNCAGPIYQVMVSNTGTITWYCAIPKTKVGQYQNVTLAPGFTATFTGSQLSDRGITTIDDIGDITLSSTPPV